MTDSRILRLITSCGLLMGVMTNATGCTAPAAPADEPPDIPPASTLLMDFDNFTDGEAAKAIVDGANPRPTQFIDNGNWGWAAIHVGVWHVLVTVGMAVPVAAFLESFNHVPVQLEDGSWVWSYDVMISGINHSAELHALAVNGDIEWEMFVTKDGFYESFSWFSGVSNLLGTSGTWTLNNTPNDPRPLLEIAWNRSPETDTGDIRYTNVVPDGPENGGYIFFGTTDADLDAFYDIFNKGQNNMISIEWNLTTRNGRVKDNDHFGDEEWRCWTTELKDTDCSS